jgi:hypothetical protein
LDRFGSKLGTWAIGLASLVKFPHELRVLDWASVHGLCMLITSGLGS